MAYEIAGQMITVPWGSTAAATTADQYTFMVIDSNGRAINPNTTSFVRPIGVLQNRPSAQGAAATIMINGVTKIRAAASTIGVGDSVAATTAGSIVAGGSTGFPRVGFILAGSSSTSVTYKTLLLAPGPSV